MYDYLRELTSSPEEAESLSRLGAPTPEALFAMMKAAPEAFRQMLGPARAAHLEETLEHRLGRDKSAILGGGPRVSARSLGARLEPAPRILPLRFDPQERDRLFEELQRLEQSPVKDRPTFARIDELKAALNALFEKASRR